MESCVGTELEWADVGATSKRAFAQQCRRTWVDETRGLTSRELELGLTVCADARPGVAEWTCDDVLSRYGVSPTGDTGDTAAP